MQLGINGQVKAHTWRGFSRSVPPPAPDEGPEMEQEASEELKELIKALVASDGNASQAARQLGISPQLMNYRMKKYKLKKRCRVKTGG